MSMFEQRLNNYKESVRPVEYYQQYIRNELVAEDGGANELMLFKHGFFIRGGDYPNTVVEICPTVSSYPSAMLNNGWVGKLGIKMFINGDEVFSLKQVPNDSPFWNPSNISCLDIVFKMVQLGYLKPDYQLVVVLNLLQSCYSAIGEYAISGIHEWEQVPFSDGSWSKEDDDKNVYWCMRKYSGKDYITKYCKSLHYKHLECPNSKVVISDISKEASPVTFEEAFQILS